MEKKFYITTTLPYVNAEPHIGFAMEIVYADIIARYHGDILKEKVFFNTGTDEHGLKIYRKAVDEGKEPQAYVDEYAEKFRNLKKALNLSDDLHFIRTTDEHHKKAAQEFWKLCEKNIDPETGRADIYKDTYKTKYCVGCELEKTDSELVDGKCPIHPNLEIEIIEEENYFFRFSKYQKPLLELYDKNPDFVVPESRLKEIRNFVESGLEDFSISRLKEKMPWGIPVPGDEKHVMYVWFDALINYISALGWPDKTQKFEEFWGTKEAPNGIQIAGKDQVRQQAAMWQAMLMSANLPNSKQIVIHGFVTSNGQKMSKSLGNVINPYEVIEKYGTDAFRYYIARELNMFDDSDFTWEKFEESYNANLANGLGNLVSRILTLSEKYIDKRVAELIVDDVKKKGINNFIRGELDTFNIEVACDMIWNRIAKLDRKISDQEVFN
ncbi:MAG TPA: methionine--tRNA ligase, partial [Candidatus Paceibacterota bacterium]|nr:methionine--tRNA ligase [Candidatus Paceibacterota bacterium]